MLTDTAQPRTNANPRVPARTAALPEETSAFTMQTCPHPLVATMYRTKMIPLGGGKAAPMHVYIPREEGDFLYSLVRHLRPTTTVEVGMANGLSTLFIAAALHDNGRGRHIAIDPFQSSDWRNAGRVVIEEAGLESIVEVRESFSHQALPDLEREGARAQFAFIDGAHLFDYAIADFLCIDRLLDVGGLIAFDDSDWPAVNQAIRFILANRQYEVAFPEVVIESRRPTPTMAARLVRAAARSMPKLAAKMRPDFLKPDEQLGIRGRCIVLRKLGEEVRDSQSRCHVAF